MKNKIKFDWCKAKYKLFEFSNEPIELNDGQKASLKSIAKRIEKNGVIIADEVGMGKTRIAVMLAKSVIESGGRVAILVPPGLGFQWNKELKEMGVETPPILRSLNGFLNAWDTNDQDAKLPWAEHSSLLISHSFCNWSLKSTTKKNWRWTLLPETLAHLRKINVSGRFPRGYKVNDKFDDERITLAAKWIAENTSKKYTNNLLSNEIINNWCNETPLFDPSEYSKNSIFRNGLEQVVGMGLGYFDLIIIDEAHKSRGGQSNLNTLLENLILQDNATRRVALTATPVELSVNQWVQILNRIKVNDKNNEIKKVINLYAEAVQQIRINPCIEEYRTTFEISANKFKTSLSPYLLRRDKREDPAVIEFAQYSNSDFHNYRKENKLLIETVELNVNWKRAICAAEALSLFKVPSEDVTSKRLRLTIANGHGVSNFIDQSFFNMDEDAHQLKHDEIIVFEDNTQIEDLNDEKNLNASTKDKNKARLNWWKNVLNTQLDQNTDIDTDRNGILYNHPAILKAVEHIESICENGEKVLVFGRFTKPMKALVDLLNARQILINLKNNEFCSQNSINEENAGVFKAAYKQIYPLSEFEFNLDTINNELLNQSKRYETQINELKNDLLNNIKLELTKNTPTINENSFFNKFENEKDDALIKAIAIAIQEFHGLSTNPTPEQQARVFLDLIKSAMSQNDNSDESDNSDEENDIKWKEIADIIIEEYSNLTGKFARLMNGNTQHSTRRLLQMAFNQEHSSLKVLVAQSLVGREGLNLHEACRHVVLLHPEWNPGVVEQQIGRVDRLGSLWEKKLKTAIAAKIDPLNLPKIEISSIIFQGTYDEKNWEVLHERWDDLRAQLHGIIISPSIAKHYPTESESIKKINNCAPNFSPLEDKLII